MNVFSWSYFRGGSVRVQWGFNEGSMRVSPRKALERPSEPPRKYNRVLDPVFGEIDLLIYWSSCTATFVEGGKWSTKNRMLVFTSPQYFYFVIKSLFLVVYSSKYRQFLWIVLYNMKNIHFIFKIYNYFCSTVQHRWYIETSLFFKFYLDFFLSDHHSKFKIHISWWPRCWTCRFL